MHYVQHLPRSLHVYSVSHTYSHILNCCNVTLASILSPQVSSFIVKSPKQSAPTSIKISHSIPSMLEWDLAVNKALQMIQKNNSSLTKVISHSVLVSYYCYYSSLHVLLHCYLATIFII